jgi:hypothetical protein
MDLVPKEKRVAEPVGRSWTVKELRRKSYDDHISYGEFFSHRCITSSV